MITKLTLSFPLILKISRFPIPFIWSDLSKLTKELNLHNFSKIFQVCIQTDAQTVKKLTKCASRVKYLHQWLTLVTLPLQYYGVHGCRIQKVFTISQPASQAWFFMFESENNCLLMNVFERGMLCKNLSNPFEFHLRVYILALTVNNLKYLLH